MRNPVLEYMRKKGITINKLSIVSRVTRPTLYDLIKGNRRANWGTLLKLSNATNGELAATDIENWMNQNDQLKTSRSIH
jgi:plasmid maintenance system antidote protein VapI